MTNDADDLEELLKSAAEYQRYAIKRSRAHYQMALLLHRRERLLGIPVIISTTVVGTAIFATLQSEADVPWKIATGLLSLSAASLAGLQTFFNFGGEAANNETASANFGRIWRGFDSFRLRHQRRNITREAALTDWDRLIKDLDEIEHGAPRILNRVWQQERDKVDASSQVPPIA